MTTTAERLDQIARERDAAEIARRLDAMQETLDRIEGETGTEAVEEMLGELQSVMESRTEDLASRLDRMAHASQTGDSGASDQLNRYDWRRSIRYADVQDEPIVRALDQLTTHALQWVHLMLHDLNQGGYIGADDERETVHDVIALILDGRGVSHSPDAYGMTSRPWLD